MTVFYVTMHSIEENSFFCLVMEPLAMNLRNLIQEGDGGMYLAPRQCPWSSHGLEMHAFQHLLQALRMAAAVKLAAEPCFKADIRSAAHQLTLAMQFPCACGRLRGSHPRE